MAEFDIISNKSRHKAHLDDIGVKTLPDQPGKRGFSADEVKAHFKAPIDYLFALLAKSMGQADDCLKGYDFSIAEINSELERIDRELAMRNVVFTPALQSEAPDSDTVHVWLDTDGTFTEDEVPKETIDLDLETQEYTFADEGDEENAAWEVDDGYTFGSAGNDAGDGYTFESTDDDDAADGYTFGDES